MAEVSTPTPAGRYHDGKTNRILSVAPVQTVMARYVDPDGKESVVLCYVFGEADYKDLKDPKAPGPRRLPGVWVVANLTQLQNTMRLAPGATALGIIAQMEEKGIIFENGKVVANGPVEVQLPDVSKVFEDLGAEEKP